MRVLLVLMLAAGTPAAAQGPPSPETETIQGLRVVAEAGAGAAGDSLAFVLAFESLRGADGEYASSPMFGMDCDRRLDRWDGAAWARVPDEGWRPEALVRLEHRPGAVGIMCRDAGVMFKAGDSASPRFAYRLGGEAEPGWYRWCLTVSVDGERGTRWLCSEPVGVAAAAPAAEPPTPALRGLPEVFMLDGWEFWEPLPLPPPPPPPPPLPLPLPPPLPAVVRSVAAVPDSLLGRWEVVRIAGPNVGPREVGIVAFRFSAGGVLMVERTVESIRASPGRAKRFRYRVEGRVLVIEDGGGGDRQAFAFEGGGLVIRDARQGIVATFRRADAP